MHARPFDPDTPDRVQDLWSGEVQPALVELHDSLHDHALVREVARAARDDVTTLLATGSALYVAFAGVGSVRDLLGTALPAAAPVVAAAAVRGHAAHSAGRKAVRDNDLFYLYEVSRRLNR